MEHRSQRYVVVSVINSNTKNILKNGVKGIDKQFKKFIMTM